MLATTASAETLFGSHRLDRIRREKYLYTIRMSLYAIFYQLGILATLPDAAACVKLCIDG